MHKKTVRVICYVLAVLIFLLGLTVYVYPFLNRAVTNNNIQENLDNFRDVCTVNNGVAKLDGDKTPSKPQNNEPKKKSDRDLHKFDELYDAMVDYNEKIYEQNQSGLKDAWSYEKAEFDLTKYSIYNNIIAELRIPAMNCDLPLYLGATWNNMAWGAVQLGQTSMPIGGENTNCVIAAHRGCTNGRYFLDIENMKKGDKVYLDNLWGTLTYKVTDIAIISPDEIDKVHIQKGKDMITLITCHPYPNNYQRYVVYCERTANDSAANGSDKNTDSDSQRENDNIGNSESASVSKSSSQTFIKIENVLIVAVPVFVVLLAVVLFIISSRKSKKKRNVE